jgi:hypothetical protein
MPSRREGSARRSWPWRLMGESGVGDDSGTG